MSALYSREVKAFYRGVTGWLLTAVLLLTAGILTAVLHLFGRSANVALVLNWLPFAAVLAAPVLTCVVFTRDRRRNADRWLRSAPLTGGGVVLAKYFAALTVFLIASAPLLLLPVLLSSFGTVSFGSAYTALAGYLLFGALTLAVCSFFAIRTRSYVFSFVVNFLICTLLSLMALVTGIMEAHALISGAVLAVGFLVFGIVSGIRRKKRLFALLWILIPWALIVVLYFAARGFLQFDIPRFLNALSPFSRLYGFLSGYFDFPALLFDLSVTALLLFLTVRYYNAAAAPERRFSIRKAAVPAVAALIVLALNLSSLLLPYRAAHPNVSGDATFRISGTTKQLLATLDRDVTVYLLNAGGETDADRDLASFVAAYADTSPHVRMRFLDLSRRPSVAGYSYEELQAAEQGLLVVSESRSRLIPPQNLYYFDCSYSGTKYTIAEYQTFLAQYASIGTDEAKSALTQILSTTSTVFAGEPVLTGAILFASAERAPVIAEYRGSGSLAPDFLLRESLEESGYEMRRITSFSEASGSDAVFLGLLSDLSEPEADLLGTYLAGGGKLFLMTTYTGTDLPNLYGVLSAYGLSAPTTPHMVYETVSDCLLNASYPYLFRPARVAMNHPATGQSADRCVLVMPHEILLTETEGVRQTSLFATSTAAMRIFSNSEVQLGSFHLAVAAETDQTRVVWIGVDVNNFSDALSGGQNFAFVRASADWLTDFVSTDPAVAAKTVPTASLNPGDSAAVVWSVILILLLPAVPLFACVIIRKKRGRG